MKEKIKNKNDAEKTISDTIKKEVASGNLDVKSLIKKVDETLQSNNEAVQNVMKKSILVRGSIIEVSIDLESVINEILLQYYNPRDHDNFKRDLLFKTLSLSQKKDIINIIIKNEKLKEKLNISSEFGKNFEEFVKIRNIYAHCPEDVFNEGGSIEITHNEFKSIKELNQNFFDLIQKLFVEFHKISVFVAEEVIKDELAKS